MRTSLLFVRVLLVVAVLVVLGPTAAVVPSPTTNYRSIGTDADILYDEGSASVSAGSSVVTLTDARLPRHIGQGDRFTLDPDGVTKEVVYILRRDSDTQVTLQTPVTRNHVNAPYTITRAYHTIQAWKDDRQGNLVADNRREVGVLYNDGPFISDGAHVLATLHGSRTDATRFLWLTVAEGQRHQGTAGRGVVLDGEDATKWGLRIRDHYTRVEWLEFTRFRGASGAAAVEVHEAKHVLLAQLLIHDFAADGHNMVGIKGAEHSDFTVRNTMIYDGDTAGIRTTERGTATIENCTIFGMAGRGVYEDSGTYTVRNTMALGNLRGDFAIRRGRQAHNLSSDGTAAGPGSLTRKDPAGQFVSLTPGAEDLRLKAGSKAIGAGLDLSAVFTQDIDGDTRSGKWDIGADAFNAAPVAHAGPDAYARTGMLATLDGSASYDPNGDLITFHWALVEAPAGSIALLEDALRPNPQFLPDLPGNYVFELVVHDGQVESRPDRMTLTAFADNAPPNARAGRDRYARVRTAVRLDGSGSDDPEEVPLNFAWSFAAVPRRSALTNADLAFSQSPTPQFVPDVRGTYVLTLRVSDGTLTDEDTVQVFARRRHVPICIKLSRARGGNTESSEVLLIMRQSYTM